jgi:hypothetical protein
VVVESSVPFGAIFGLPQARESNSRRIHIARNFEEFLAMICADPADFLYQRGCYTRYSDGNTAIQWIPKEFLDNEIDIG